MAKGDKFGPVINKKRGVSVVVYDMQGGPIPPSVSEYLEDAAFNAVQMADGLAYTVVVE